MSKITSVSSGYLWQTASSPAVMALRQRAWGLLGLYPGARVLDIGCGPGTALASLAAQVGPFGQMVGVDHDPDMVKQAQAYALQIGVGAWAGAQVANATELPFAVGGFDACFSERLLQHLAPDVAQAAVKETARVLRPGGTAVFIDSDWASFSVGTAEDELERRLQAHNLARFQNPYSGRTLGRLLRTAGFGFVYSEPHVVPLSANGVTALLAGAEKDALVVGALSDAEAERWHQALADLKAIADTAGTLTMTVAAGRRL